MQKKVMALAVAGALAAPAAAFAQAVQIYGRANVGLDQYQATGATNSAQDLKSRTRVYDQGSRLGVRGSEDLGNGLKAIFQIESGVNIDTGSTIGQNGVANPSTGTFASRDSYGGLEGGWGRLTFGRQSVFWVNGVNSQFQGNYINVEIPWANGATLGRVAGPSARTNNVMQYTSPTMGGFNLTASYAPQSETAAAGANTDGRLMGLTVRWSGLLNVQFDYATNTQATPATGSQSKITGTKLGVGWPYAPGAQVSVIVTQDKNEGPASFSAGDNVQARAITLTWEQIFGNIQALAQAGRLNKATGCSGTLCDDTNAQAYLVGARYLMSKRTAAYLTVTQTTNKAGVAADYTGGNMNAGTIGLGADPRIWAIGMIHNF